MTYAKKSWNSLVKLRILPMKYYLAEDCTSIPKTIKNTLLISYTFLSLHTDIRSRWLISIVFPKILSYKYSTCFNRVFIFDKAWNQEGAACSFSYPKETSLMSKRTSARTHPSTRSSMLSIEEDSSRELRKARMAGELLWLWVSIL